MSLTWNQLFSTGSIVSLKVGKWRAQVKLTARDLGLEASKDVQKALTLGRCRLAPAKAFNNINNAHRKASQLVDLNSMNFSGIPGARYVPEKKVEPLLLGLVDAKKEFDQAVEEFMGFYMTNKLEMLPVIERAIKDAAQDSDSATRAFLRLKSEFPTEDEVRSLFDLDWNVYALQSPKNQNTAEAISQESDKVKGVVAEMVKQARDEVTEKLKQILEIVNKGGSLKSTSVESAIGLLDRIESLNIMGDKVLSDQISALKGFLSGVEKGKTPEGFTLGLNEIQATLEKSVDQAIIDAEKKLTGLGNRKLEV